MPDGRVLIVTGGGRGTRRSHCLELGPTARRNAAGKVLRRELAATESLK